MDVREWANSNPKSAYGATAACVTVAVGVMVFQLIGDRRPPLGTAPLHYYTVDDGKTYFEAPGSNIAPFQYEGKTAVRAHVYACGGQRFVAYLSRYTPEAQKAKIAKTIKAQMESGGRELKRPGETAWTATTDRAAVGKLVDVAPPAGMSGVPEPVEP